MRCRGGRKTPAFLECLSEQTFPFPWNQGFHSRCHRLSSWMFPWISLCRAFARAYQVHEQIHSWLLLSILRIISIPFERSVITINAALFSACPPPYQAPNDRKFLYFRLLLGVLLCFFLTSASAAAGEYLSFIILFSINSISLKLAPNFSLGSFAVLLKSRLFCAASALYSALYVKSLFRSFTLPSAISRCIVRLLRPPRSLLYFFGLVLCL